MQASSIEQHNAAQVRDASSQIQDSVLQGALLTVVCTERRIRLLAAAGVILTKYADGLCELEVPVGVIASVALSGM